MENLPLSLLSSAYLFETRGKKPSMILYILGKGRLCPSYLLGLIIKVLWSFFSVRLFSSPVENDVLECSSGKQKYCGLNKEINLKILF